MAYSVSVATYVAAVCKLIRYVFYKRVSHRTSFSHLCRHTCIERIAVLWRSVAFPVRRLENHLVKLARLKAGADADTYNMVSRVCANLKMKPGKVLQTEGEETDSERVNQTVIYSE